MTLIKQHATATLVGDDDDDRYDRMCVLVMMRDMGCERCGG